MRARWIALGLAGLVACLAAPAHADPRAEIAAKTRAAMASYDDLDYDAARRQLNQALAIAKTSKLEDDPIVARVYLQLGIALVASADPEAARLAFLSAALIDPQIAVEPAYRSPEVVRLLDEARAAARDAAAGPAAARPDRTADRTAASAAAPAANPDGADAEIPPARPVAGSAGASGRRPRVLLAVTGGTGLGYVTGRTEDDNVVETCCIGASPVVLAAELGYRAGDRLAIGVAARIGLPLGANIAGHATLAPAGLVRVRYALSDTGNGLHVAGALGAGVLRNTIKLDETGAMTTDIVAQGPLLVGTGLGYTHWLGARLAFVAELDALAGIAVVDELGSAVHLNTGISADLRVGLSVGF